jgi:hypothetical protein
MHAGEEPRNPHVRYEPHDVNARTLTRLGLLMAGMIVIFLFGLWGVFDLFVKHEAELGLPSSRAALINTQKQPPEPRLQANPARDMRDMRAAEERLLHEYSWIDPDKGIVRIPIDRAMDLIAQRGLPASAQGKTQ